MSKPIEISYQKQDLEEVDVSEYSTASTLSFFLKHSYRDVGRKKFHFCLSFCSVFIVVWSALVINTLVEQGPIIFLKLAEGDVGQFDGIMQPTKGDSLDGFKQNAGIFLNYSRISEVVGNDFNLAPRKMFCGATTES